MKEWALLDALVEAIDEDGTEESSEEVVEKPCECKHPHHTLGLQVLL